jgi:hypothetical protein
MRPIKPSRGKRQLRGFIAKPRAIASGHRACRRQLALTARFIAESFGGEDIAAIGNEFALFYGNPPKVRAASSGVSEVERVVAGA